MFSKWEKKLLIDYEDLYVTDTPSSKTGVTQDSLPPEMDWIAMLNRLANDDITKHEEIYKINYEHCLRLMVYWKYRDKINQQAHKAMMNKK